MGLKRAFKKLRKSVGLPALTLGSAGRIGAAIVTRGKSEKVVQALKGVGAAVKGIKGAPAPRLTKAEKAQVLKQAMAVPRPTIVPISSVSATAKPGGAPIAKRKRAAARPRRAATPKRAARKPRAARKARAASGGVRTRAKRTPPKGGLDLKGLSAAWKAAGKPGTWAEWVKSGGTLQRTRQSVRPKDIVAP